MPEGSGGRGVDVTTGLRSFILTYNKITSCNGRTRAMRGEREAEVIPVRNFASAISGHNRPGVNITTRGKCAVSHMRGHLIVQHRLLHPETANA